MGHWEWEGGTITLPANEFTNVFHAVLTAQKRRQALMLGHAEKFWALIPPKAKRNKELYREWVRAYVMGNEDAWDSHRRFGWAKPAVPAQKGVVRDPDGTESWALQDLLESVTWEWKDVPHTTLSGATITTKNRVERNPRKVTKAMVENAFPATNKTTTFHFGEATIQFDRKKRTVNYSSGENRHVIEAARSHPLGKALFAALDGVTWTRGSGGKILGNNEYNAEDHSFEGAGGTYVVDEYGPKHPRHRPYGGVTGYGRTAGRW